MSIIPYNNGNIPTYRFYVTFHTITYEVFPLEFFSTAIAAQRERGQMFYRRKFEGELTFGTNSIAIDVSGVEQNRQDDWALFWLIHAIDPCQRLDLTITKTVSGVTNTYWEGYFATANGEWDLDSCTFTITPFVSDDYVELLAQGDLEYNVYINTLFYENTVLTRGGTLINLTNGAIIVDLIEWLAGKIIPAITVSSDFLENATNPVTNTTNRYNHLTLHYKRDVKSPGLGLFANTTIMMSFNQIMDLLKCMNLYWEYDGTNLIIEHISHWADVDGIDTRNQLSMVAKNKFKYLNTYPKYEKFKWAEAGHEDFIGTDIYYDSDCVNQDPDSNSTELRFDITTDVEYILDRGSDDALISDSGWVILSNLEYGGNLYLNFNIGLIDPTLTHFNMDMSWSYLHNLFFKDDRTLITGYMNGVLTTFYSAKKTKQQDCSIIVCDDFDETESLITELGETYFAGETGKVDKASIKPTGQIDLTLLYGPTPNANPGYTYNKYIVITEVKTGLTSVFTAYCSEFTTAQLDISIYVHNRNAALNECTSDTEILTIAINDNFGTCTVTWCTPVGGDPTCRIDVHDDSAVSAAGWIVLYILDTDADC